MSAGTLRRILNGTIELKLRHITDLLTVLEIPTKTFFRIAFESEDSKQAEALLAQALQIAQPEPQPVPLNSQEIEEVVLATIRRLGFAPPKASRKKPGKKDDDPKE